MLKYTVLLALAFGLMAAKCTPGSSINSADPAWCKTTYLAQETCEMDAACRWVVRPDNKGEVCKAKK